MPLKTSVTELPESRVRVRAEVPAEEVERQVQRAARQLGRQMRIPGFRKGKVPPPVVIGRLGRRAVLDEALKTSLTRWYSDAIDEAGIVPVGAPRVAMPEELPVEGQPLEFSIEIGVRPKAKLGGYKGLEVARREPRVDLEHVERELDRLRERLATLETAKRPAQSGDHVVIDYAGAIGGEPFEGGEGRDRLLELGTGRLLPGFDEQLIGAVAGDRRTIEVTFPDDHPVLGGRRATFEVLVKEVKVKRLPELDDEFATQAAGLDTLEELRADIAAKVREADEAAVEREFQQAVLDAAVAQAQIDVPPKLVHARARELLQETLSALARQGISKESFLRLSGKGEEDLAREAEPEAEAILKREAVLAAVVEAEGIEPTDEELLEAIRSIAQPDGSEPAKVLAALRERGRLGPIAEQVASRKALELLVSEAKPISVEQAKAREELWTPEKGKERGSGRLWTPGG